MDSLTYIVPVLAVLAVIAERIWKTSRRNSGGIFVSYRRADDPGLAGRIKDRIEQKFTNKKVFYDVESIVAGQDFSQAIDGALQRAKVMVVLIGKTWVRESRGQDYVVHEVRAALERSMSVIPVLLEGAKMPAADGLPIGLQQITRHQYVELSSTSFDQDMSAILRAIEQALGGTGSLDLPAWLKF